MPCRFSHEKIKRILAGCVKKADLEDSYVEMIQTRGMSPNFVRDPRNSDTTLHGFCSTIRLDT